MQHVIKGTTMPVLEIALADGEAVISESGELSWMTGAVEMRTATGLGASKKGLLGMAKRAVSGGTIWMSEYKAEGGSGAVAFAIRAPGVIRELPLDGTKEYVLHKHGFVCADEGVALDMFFQQKLGAAVFGREGFLLQKVHGQGTAFIEMHGEVCEYDLQAGQVFKVHPGHIAMFESSVQMSITTVPGIKNKVFGGNGIFLCSLTGPGKIWLQSLSLARLAQEIEPYLPASNSNGSTAQAGGVGALLGAASSLLDSGN